MVNFYTVFRSILKIKEQLCTLLGWKIANPWICFFNHQKLLYDKCFVYVVEKNNNLGDADFFFKNTPFIKQDSQKRIMPCKKEKKILSTLKFWQEKLIWAFFSRVKKLKN